MSFIIGCKCDGDGSSLKSPPILEFIEMRWQFASLRCHMLCFDWCSYVARWLATSVCDGLHFFLRFALLLSCPTPFVRLPYAIQCFAHTSSRAAYTFFFSFFECCVSRAHTCALSYRLRAMSTPSRKRLMRDFKRPRHDPPAGISGAP